jgi:AcrR family transcriptional regulator
VPADSEDTTLRRPRLTPEREVELLDAAMDVLREVGYQDLSMDLVAAKARCSKATLYRLWPSKPELVAAGSMPRARSEPRRSTPARSAVIC